MPHEPFDATGPAGGGDADRRTVRRAGALGAAAVALTALATAGIAQGAGAASAPAATIATAADSPGAVASASPSASAAVPQLHIQIAYDRVGRDLTLSFTFSGFVVEPLDTNGNRLTFPTPATRDIGLGEKLDWGDGTNADAPVTGRRCPAGAETRTVHEISDAYQAKKHYAAPGAYTVNYTYFACGLSNGKISGTLTVNIPK